MSLAYYNEHDAYAAHWLRNLIAAGHIAPGVVDERDIRDVRPEELIGFTQVHMFAGIGVWSLALRSAGWADDRPIWTGSCPCQPFSAAGRAGGFADERHLWPHWFWLIEQCRPSVVCGEQVSSKDGLGWFDLVSADLEGTGYAVGAVDLCAAGIGVEWQESQSGEWLRGAIHDCADPVVRTMLCDFADWAGAGNISEGGNHIRQRLYFVGLADPMPAGRSERRTGAGSGPTARLRASGGMDDDDARSQGLAGDDRTAGRERSDRPITAPGISVGLADNFGQQRSGSPTSRDDAGGWDEKPTAIAGLRGNSRPDAANLGRYAKDWLFCRDDKWRAVRPGSFPLAHGVTARVGKLRAFGNALDAKTATRFCEAVKEICDA